VLGRGHVQTHDVFELLDELRVARDLEAAHQVRLQSVGLPVPHHGAGADLQHRGHLARAPVRSGFGRALRSQLHQLGNVHFDRWRTARQVPRNTLHSALQIAFAPACHLHLPDAKLLGDVLVLQALRRKQHDLRTLRQPDAGALGARKSRQLAFLLIRQLDRRGNSQLPAPMQTEVEHWKRVMQLSSLKSRTLH